MNVILFYISNNCGYRYVELHLDQFVDLLDPDNQPSNVSILSRFLNEAPHFCVSDPKGRALTPGTTPKKTRIEVRTKRVTRRR